MKQKLHLVGYLLIQYNKDARYHEHKIRDNVVMNCLRIDEDREELHAVVDCLHLNEIYRFRIFCLPFVEQ